jgi:hypothetical protein
VGEEGEGEELSGRYGQAGGRRPILDASRGYFFFGSFLAASFFGFLVSFFWALFPLAMMLSPVFWMTERRSGILVQRAFSPPQSRSAPPSGSYLT